MQEVVSTIYVHMYVQVVRSIYELSLVLRGRVEMQLGLMLRKIVISDFNGLRRQRNNGRN